MTVRESTSSSLYNRGIFSTVAILNGQPLLWASHWQRLTHNAAQIGIDLSTHSERAIEKALSVSIAESGIVDGRARITFIDESESPIWSNASETEVKTGLSILVGRIRLLAHDFRLTVSEYTTNSRSPLAGVKSCNYLEQILSLDEAKGRGFHEAVRVNERGHVTSGCMSNIFWLKNGRLYTPTLATGCLAGTTREYVLENIACEEVEAEIGELESVDAIFLTSAGLGIVRVAEYDGRELPDTKHPIQTLWPPS